MTVNARIRYEAIQFPHGNCVIEKPGDLILAALPSLEEARVYADTLTRWLQARPQPQDFRVYRDFDGPPRPAPTETDLMLILDRLDDPENRLDILEESLRREFRLLGMAA
jgi:hypothetical protein